MDETNERPTEIAAARTAMPALLAEVASLRETLAFTLDERDIWRQRAEDRVVAHRADIDRLATAEAEAAELRTQIAALEAAGDAMADLLDWLAADIRCDAALSHQQWRTTTGAWRAARKGATDA